MKNKILVLTFVALIAVLALSACGGGSSPVTVNDIPAYPGANALQPGDSKMADQLAKNSQQITAMSQSLGAGGKTEQKGFSLPQDASWDAVKKFYDDKLGSAGWAAPNSTVANVLAQTNSQNDVFQVAIYQRGNQSLSVIRMTSDPTTKDEMLVLSLSTH